MIKYAICTRDRLRGDVFVDLAEAVRYAGEIAVAQRIDPADVHVRDSLENLRRWASIDRDTKTLTEPTLHLSEPARREPGGDVHAFEAEVGCSRKLGTVDGLLRRIIANHRADDDTESLRSRSGPGHSFN